MENQIPPEIKNRRMDEISSASEKAVSSFLTKCIGDRRIVLFEEQEGPYVTGYTDNYIKVYVKSNELNCFKEVKLLEIYKDGMKGEI